jgi:GT2 family glycosyltransferase
MSVTVVVCNYNGEEHLPLCLDALSVMRGDVAEIIVVDNASTDRSRELLQRDYPGVRALLLDKNEGPSVARNAGLHAAQTDLVLAVDNDAVVAADTLEKLLSAYELTGAVIVQPRSVLASEPSRVHYDGGALHYAGLISLHNFYCPLQQAKGEGVVESGCAIAVCLLMDRCKVLDAGGYDGRYFILFEDNDLSYRLRSRGERIVSVEDAIVKHRAGTAGISFRDGPHYPARRVFLHSRNRWVFLAKNHSWLTLLLTLPGLAVYEVFALLFAVASGHPLSWAKGKLAALRMIPGLWGERRQVQRARSVRDGELLHGGPLTVTPAVARSGLKVLFLRSVDSLLQLWWELVRRLL